MCAGIRRSHSTPLHVSGWMSIAWCGADRGSELRLVRTACLIEMHYRSASPAGSEAAAIVHNLTAYRPTRGGRLFNGKQGPSQKRQKMIIDQILPVFRSFLLTSLSRVLIARTWLTQGSFTAPAEMTYFCLRQTLKEASEKTCFDWAIFLVIWLLSHWVNFS